MNDENPFSLEGRYALVTGGGTGLGLAISKALVRQYSQVIITGRREEVLQKACEELGPKAHYIKHDISRLDTIPGLVRKVESDYGPLDILVNNAGVHLKKEALMVSDEEFASVIRTNQQAVFSLTREVAAGMAARGRGSIIMISSMASRYGIPKVIAYTSSKAAIEGMTRALAVEWSPRGVRVNCLAPGFIQTDMSAGALDSDPERKRRVLEKTPMGYLGKPEDIGNAASFLVSDAASYITGVVLPVDGGNSIGF